MNERTETEKKRRDRQRTRARGTEKGGRRAKEGVSGRVVEVKRERERN